MATVLYADGRAEPLTPHGRTFTLEELQAIVGGYIEIVRVPGGFLVVNEDGLLRRLPRNGQASRLHPSSPIVGDAVLCDPTEID